MITSLDISQTGALLCALGVLGFVLHPQYLRRLLAFNLASLGSLMILAAGSGPVTHLETALLGLIVLGMLVILVINALTLHILRQWQAQGGHSHPDKEQTH